MYILPAIDLLDNKAVRLLKGDYHQVTVYNDDPVAVAKDFKKQGATHIHVVDLAGAKCGEAVHFQTVKNIVDATGLFVEIGGGIRTMQMVDKYLSAGAKRVILGTAAVTDEVFLKQALEKHQEKIAVGADIVDGKVAVKGWLEQSQYTLNAFLDKMQSLGVKTIICTDVSKDGAMKGTNVALYQSIKERYGFEMIASGGVSSMADITALKKANVDGAIIGKAYYVGAIDLSKAIKEAK